MRDATGVDGHATPESLVSYNSFILIITCALRAFKIFENPVLHTSLFIVDNSVMSVKPDQCM